ncbi:MAG: acyltransferase [Thalassobius sp.]|nr:acyltransferase [Thalassovita sp.]
MVMKLLSKLVFRITGWKVDNRVPREVKQFVMIAAPHTSNWDLIFARGAFFIMGIPLKFTIKKEWVQFPLSLFMKPLGAIPIDRKPKQAGLKKRSMVHVMAELFKIHDDLVILVTPEGTRQKASKWKLGFYRIAEEAGVPIAFGYLDYSQKIAGIGGILETTGDIKKDMQVINEFYSQKTPKFPEKFSVHQL